MPRNREEADLFFCSVTPLQNVRNEKLEMPLHKGGRRQPPNLENRIWEVQGDSHQVSRIGSGEPREYKSTWQAYDSFFGLPRSRTVHSSPNRLAVSVTQLASPKGRHMILDSRFWILDCGLKEHESHCRKCRSGESGSSSIAVMSALRVCLCSCSSPMSSRAP